MTSTVEIKVNKIAKSRVGEYDVNNVPFGKCFSDHMFVAEYSDGKWQKAYIEPYQDIPMSYAMSALHYGQAIFEGMKAYKNEKGEVSLFRPTANFQRMNKSAVRMAMPEVPEEIFMGGLLELIKLDKDWVPSSETGSLYIRPFLIATDEAIGVKASDTYKFVIITCPAGKYYSEPIRVLVETNYIRAVEGGVGNVKAAGNYGRSLYPTKLAQQKGYQQVIWTDSMTHSFVEESGTMNLMFVIWKDWQKKFSLSFNTDNSSLESKVIQKHDISMLLQSPSAKNGWESIWEFNDPSGSPHYYSVSFEFCTVKKDSPKKVKKETTEPVKKDTIKPKEQSIDLPSFYKIYFESSKAVLTIISEKELSIIYDNLKNNNTLVEIFGYQKNENDRPDALKLYNERALVICNYLMTKGLDQKRIQYIGYGDKNTASEKNKKRIELKILE